MKTDKGHEGARPGGRRIAGRAQEDHVVDPYQQRRKPQEPSRCPDCGAVFHAGRWQWAEVPEGAEALTCPACERAGKEDPAGIVELSGGFLRGHREEIVSLARHLEEQEKREHALNRILAIRERSGGLEITTSDIHLPRRIGEAVAKAYQGELDYHYEPERYFLRVSWTREA